MSAQAFENADGRPSMLLITLAGYYDTDIKGAFEDLGVKVDMVNERPNNGVAFKASVRLGTSFYNCEIERYFDAILDSRRGNDYDYVVVIRGEYFIESAIRKFRAEFSRAEFVLYLWDSAANYPAVKERWPLYDRVLSFDRRDVEEHPILTFRPLFFVSAFDRRTRTESQCHIDYTVAFVGTAHSDRPRIVNEVKRQIEDKGGAFYSYWYQPATILFYYNKLRGKGFAGLHANEVHHELLPREEVARTLLNARATVDVEHPNQVGLTMRTIESIGLGIKLITTNRDIMHYDFYDDANVFVVDRRDPIVDFDFIDKPCKPLNSQMLERYSISGWAEEILGLNRAGGRPAPVARTAAPNERTFA